jgi:hypothetical protein
MEAKPFQWAPEQQFLNDLWEEHIRDEFATRDTDATIDTMAPDAYVNHVPVLTGVSGANNCANFTRSISYPECRRTRRLFPFPGRSAPGVW